ncbi:hypothetical protein [Agromyces marinus]|uniref:Uncharacterized protein n=1 Tax=Agromyces marinus TaxID=1389020 RepID=A0ABM8H0D9_9MICO|nr:hypothetical protein [Agromyces marinus]UIP57626.1 hypothetical protein DSM26151_04910 [Agromyces marinus]BDZ54219.1 hypothetical protein GCM10025870_12920 [Agromyces marinus]
MTQGDGEAGNPRLPARRRARRGMLGVALFVGGPVVGTALVVVGIVLGLAEEPRLLLLAVLGVGVVFVATYAGLRVLFAVERAGGSDRT